MSAHIVVDGFFIHSLLDGSGAEEEAVFLMRIKGYIPSISPTASEQLIGTALKGIAEAREALDMISATRDGNRFLVFQLDGIFPDHVSLVLMLQFKLNSTIPSTSKGSFHARSVATSAVEMHFHAEHFRSWSSNRMQTHGCQLFCHWRRMV